MPECIHYKAQKFI